MRHMFLSGLLLLLGGLVLPCGIQAKEANDPANSPTAANTTQPQLKNKSSLAFYSLEQMDELARLGMPALALRLSTQQQQRWPMYSPQWYAFERKRISLLAVIENWQAIIDSADKLLKNVVPGKQITGQIRQWFITQQIIARLQLRQPEKALSQVRKLLWNPDNVNADSRPVALWRRLVVRAYLLMHADDDAQSALLRYQQDYSHNNNNLNEDWRILQARTLLRIHRPEEVITLLADSVSEIEQALRLVAAIRARPDHASLYVKQAETAMVETKLSRAELWSYRYVLYEAALHKKNLLQTSKALQNLLALGNPYSGLGEEFYVSGDDLWQLFESIGNTTGNRLKLLLGDDFAWYNKASELQQSQPIEALGLYSVLVFNAHDKTSQALAHKEIVGLLEKDVNGLELINQLYLKGSRISSIDSLPIEVRYSLVDYALSKGDIKLAARLMQSLQQPPAGQDMFEWQMRKARVLIMEGSYDQGEHVLRTAVAENEQLSSERIDQLIQVVFDLQAVQRHQQAIEFIDSLKEEWLDDDIRRELFFWKAESSYVLGQYASAAWLYLKSAMVADQTQSELWAQSARFKAAGSLVKAGLYDDAQTLYTELLRLIASDSRKAFIKQEIQQIRLLRNAEKTSQSEL